MPLTLHHLTKSQSERIVFLLEELELPYTLKVHERDPQTAMSPASLKSVSPTGTAPTLFDDPPNPNTTSEPVIICESTACLDYILQTYAPDSALIKKPGDENYVDYITWLHFANGTIQPTVGRLMMFERTGIKSDNPMFQFVEAKLKMTCNMAEKQLTKTKAYLAGPELTAADIMCFFSITTMRGFYPFDLSNYPAILDYFQRVAARPAYQRTMEKGDKGLKPLLGASVDRYVWG